MMIVEKLSGIILLLIFSSLCPIALTHHQTAVSNNFVNKTCNKFEEERVIKLCIDVIDSDSQEDLKLDLWGLLAIFINHTIANATNSHSYLVEQLKRSDIDNRTRQVFDFCMKEYEGSIAQLKSSLEALLKDHDTKLSLSITDAFDMVEICEYEFEGFTPEPPSWLSRFLILGQLMNLSMGTANLLECKRVAACIP